MSERRRSIFVLLVVAALIGASIYVVLTKPTKLGLDLQGGSQLVYQAEPTAQQQVDPEAMQRSIDLMQERVNAFGVSEAEINQAGDDQIEVNLPGVENAEEAAAQVGSTAQLFFYDWEANILDEDCKTDPDQNANGRQPVVGLRTAVEQASKCTERRHRPGARSARRRRAGRPVRGGVGAALLRLRQDDEEAAQQRPVLQLARGRAGVAGRESERANAEVIEVPAGVLVLRAERPSEDGPKPDRWWVIQDRPGLSGTEIRNPEQSFDQGVNNQPIVTFNFTDKGRKAFQAITRKVAQRGADNALGGPPIQTSQHFAIALDNELISAPYINWQENPDGIDGATGAQISGSLHDPVRAEPRQAAQDRRPAAEADRDLALAGLRHARCPGARPGPEGRHRGLRHRRALPDPLLPRAGRDRDLRAVHLRALLLRAGQADPDHADAAGHRGPDPDAGRRGRREHRRLRTRQRGGAGREIDLDRDRHGLPQGPDGDHRREHRHVPGRVHPLHHRDRRRPRVRLHARSRRHRLALHGGARHPGDPVLAARDAPHPLARRARRRRAAREVPDRLHGQGEVVLLRRPA